MINKRDVLRIKMPFPNISSQLAFSAHMYICYQVNGSEHRFIKCQTLKPKMIGSSLMRHYWDEYPDLARNPFGNVTRIDCDKLFITAQVQYSDAMKTVNRPDVSQDVMDNVERELLQDGYNTYNMNDGDVISLNCLTSWT